MINLLLVSVLRNMLFVEWNFNRFLWLVADGLEIGNDLVLKRRVLAFSIFTSLGSTEFTCGSALILITVLLAKALIFASSTVFLEVFVSSAVFDELGCAG